MEGGVTSINGFPRILFFPPNPSNQCLPFSPFITAPTSLRAKTTTFATTAAATTPTTSTSRPPNRAVRSPAASRKQYRHPARQAALLDLQNSRNFPDALARSGEILKVHDLNFILREFGRLKRYTDLSQLFEWMQKYGKVNVTSYSSYIKFTGESSNPMKALEAYNHISDEALRNHTSICNSILSCLIKNSRFDSAISLFHQMKQKGLQPDMITYSTLLAGCIKDKNGYSEAMQLVKEMESNGLQMDSVTYGALIAVYAANGQCKEAEEYFSRMKSEGHSPNVYHYSSLLNAFSADGNHIKAGELVSDMKSDGLVPNEVICTPLLKVYARAGLFEKSRQFLSEMDASGYAEDEIPYCLLMDAFSKSGQIDEAMVVFHEMCSHKVKSDGYAYSIMISAFYRGGRLIEAKQLARDYQSMNGLMEGCVEPSMYGIKMFKLTEEMPNNDEGLSQDEKFFFTQRFDDLQAIHGLGTSSIEYLEDEVQKEKKKLILSSLLRQFKRPEIFAFDPGGGLLLPVVSQSLASTRETPLSAQVAIDDFVASITSWQLIFGHYFGKAIMLHNIGSYMLKLSSSKESKTSLIELIRWVWKASSESETETELKFSYLGVDWHEARSLIFDPGGYLAEDWLISHYNLKCCYCLNLVGQINEIFEVFWPHVPENYASRMVKVTRGVLNASIRKFVFDPGGGALLLIGKSLKLELVASLKDLQSTEIEITEGSAIGELLESFGMKGKLISGSLGDTILAMQKYSRQYKNILNFDPEREGARLEDHVIYLSVRDEFAYMSEIALSRGMWLMQTEVERSFLIWILLPCFTLLARTSRWSMAISLALTRKLLVIYQRVLQLGKRKVNVNLQDGLMGAASMVIKLEDFAEIKAHSLLLEVAEELVVFGKKFLKSYVAISLTGLLEARSLDWLRTTSTTSHHRYISCRILFFYELVIDDP